MEIMEIDKPRNVIKCAANEKHEFRVAVVPQKLRIAILKKVDLRTRFRLRKSCSEMNHLVEYSRFRFHLPEDHLTLWIVYSPFGRNIEYRVVRTNVASFIQRAMDIYGTARGNRRGMENDIGTEITDPYRQLSSVHFDEILLQRGPFEGKQRVTLDPSAVVEKILLPSLKENKFKCKRLQLSGILKEEFTEIISNISFDEFDGSRLFLELGFYLEHPSLLACRSASFSMIEPPKFRLYNWISHYETVEMHNFSFAYNFGGTQVSYMSAFCEFLVDMTRAPVAPRLKYLHMEGANYEDLFRYELKWPQNHFLFKGQCAMRLENEVANWTTLSIYMIWHNSRMALVVSTHLSEEDNRWQEIYFLENDDRLPILEIVVATAFRRWPIDVSSFADEFLASKFDEMHYVLFDMSTYYGYFCCLGDYAVTSF